MLLPIDVKQKCGWLRYTDLQVLKLLLPYQIETLCTVAWFLVMPFLDVSSFEIDYLTGTLILKI